jgi:hypothetical protein
MVTKTTGDNNAIQNALALAGMGFHAMLYFISLASEGRAYSLSVRVCTLTIATQMFETLLPVMGIGPPRPSLSMDI